jgi:hypothetical protein
MNKRPVSVAVIGLLLIATGALGLVFHLGDFRIEHPFQNEVLWAALVRILAILAGAYLLRGANWARCLALGWMAFHVVLSVFHSWAQVAFHAVLFAAFAYFLFRPEARRFFAARE